MAKATTTHNVNGCIHGSKPGAVTSWDETTCGNCLKKKPEPVAIEPEQPTLEEQGAQADKLLVDDSVGNEPTGEPTPAPWEISETEVVAPVAAAQTVEPYTGPKTKFSGSAADRRKQRRALRREGLAA